MRDEESLDVFIGKMIIDSDFLGHYDKIDPIFHYTSPDGLLGILQENGPVLWFSQHDSLNDTTEGTHVVDVYQHVCDNLFSIGKISSDFYQAIRDVKPTTREMFLYNLENLKGGESAPNPTDYCRTEESQKYICCFSKNRDSLPMWNYYSKGDKYEGYNIGFSFWRTCQLGVQSCYGKGYNFDLFTVIYDDNEKENIIQKKIEELYPYYRNVDNDEVDAKVLPRIRNALSYYLKALGLKFKQECFQHEQEVRAILTVPKSSTKFKTEYRSKAGYIIPYIKLQFPVQIISGITVGPLLNDQSAVKNIKQFVRDYHYSLNESDIQSSKIPIRY